MLELLPSLSHDLLLLLYISATFPNIGILRTEEWLSQVTLALHPRSLLTVSQHLGGRDR